MKQHSRRVSTDSMKGNTVKQHTLVTVTNVHTDTEACLYTLLWNRKKTSGCPEGEPVMRQGAGGPKFEVCEAREVDSHF